MAPGRCARSWTCVLDLGLTLWVLRAIVVALLFGFAILGLAPQAQDLLVDVAAGPWWYTILFLLAVFFVWAMPTHYAARLLVETDAGYLLRVRRRRSRFLDGLKNWTPRVLGLLPFLAMLIGVARSWSNVPTVDVSGIAALAQLADISSGTKVSLLLLGGYLAFSTALFWWYVAI